MHRLAAEDRIDITHQPLPHPPIADPPAPDIQPKPAVDDPAEPVALHLLEHAGAERNLPAQRLPLRQRPGQLLLRRRVLHPRPAEPGLEGAVLVLRRLEQRELALEIRQRLGLVLLLLLLLLLPPRAASASALCGELARRQLGPVQAVDEAVAREAELARRRVAVSKRPRQLRPADGVSAEGQRREVQFDLVADRPGELFGPR